MKSSIRRKYFLWLSAVLVIHFTVQGCITIGHDLREISRAEAAASDELSEIALVVLTDLLTLPLMFGVIWFVSKKMLEPLASVAATANRIGAGDLTERIAVENRNDDIGRVAVALNDAFDRYQQAMDRVRRFSSDASHQLRTPLTAMRSIGEVCLRKDRTPEEYRDKMASMLEEVQRLSRIVEQLLALSRLERPNLRERFSGVDLGTVIRRATDTYEPFAKEKEIDLGIEVPPGLQVRGDGPLLEQIIANLVDNAIRHTPVGGSVRVRAEQAPPSSVAVRVEDTGPGIPENEQTRIFERFVSLPHAETHGAGLGLAIVADIVKLHDGTVRARPNLNGGATLTVTLPAA